MTEKEGQEGGGGREGERGPFEGRRETGGRGSGHYNWRVRCDPDHINGHSDPAPDVQRVSTTSHLLTQSAYFRINIPHIWHKIPPHLVQIRANTPSSALLDNVVDNNPQIRPRHVSQNHVTLSTLISPMADQAAFDIWTTYRSFLANKQVCPCQPLPTHAQSAHPYSSPPLSPPSWPSPSLSRGPMVYSPSNPHPFSI